ncbi:hypothetical protein [Nonomuraea jabiensis]|uniref:hypothetical protein n=1 Tax=Nonomuraea jabiensis TaxID=882448 RepID=UPI003676C741
MKRYVTTGIAMSVAVPVLAGGASASAQTFRGGSVPDSGVSWRACAERPGAECGVVEVPLDWNAPSGAKIKLSLVRRKAADSSARVGTLFYNPGGPGVPAALLVRDYADTFSEELRRRFDIVGIDPRGVGESIPALRCGQPVHNPEISQFPKNRAAYDRLVDWCDRTATCALRGRDVSQVWDRLVTAAERAPIGVSGGRPLTAEELRYSAYAFLTMTPEFAGGLATAITQAEQGDAQLFATIWAQALDDPVSTAAYRSILCQDIDPEIRSGTCRRSS